MAVVCRLMPYLMWAFLWPLWLCHPKLRGRLDERWGRLGHLGPPRPGVVRVWAHGASAGDVLGLLPTLRALRARLGGLEVVVTSMTHSGRRIALQHPQLVSAAYLSPWDLRRAAERAVLSVQPALLLVEHAELWPQLFAAAGRAGVPVVLHNLQLRAGRARAYRLLFACCGNLLQQARLMLVRSEAAAACAIGLGAPAARLQVTGSTKVDQVAGQAAPAWPRAAAGGLTWVAGSTHRGEEALLLTVFAQLAGRFDGLRLVLAPRYVERAGGLMRLAARRGLGAQLSSQLSGPQAQAALMGPLVVVDQLGTLASWYQQADVAFVGGTLVRRGGQNLLEPALAQRPVLFGPHTARVADLAAALCGHGGVQVDDAQALQQVLAHLLASARVRQALGRRALRRARALGGTAQRNAACLSALLQPLGQRA